MLRQLPPKRGKRLIRENGAPQNHFPHFPQHTTAQNSLARWVDFCDFWGCKIVPNSLSLISVMICIYTEPNIVVMIGLKAQTG